MINKQSIAKRIVADALEFGNLNTSYGRLLEQQIDSMLKVAEDSEYIRISNLIRGIPILSYEDKWSILRLITGK